MPHHNFKINPISVKYTVKNCFVSVCWYYAVKEKLKASKASKLNFVLETSVEDIYIYIALGPVDQHFEFSERKGSYDEENHL